MAISATINKLSLNIADMDRHYYQTHDLVIAQHPSETGYRFMMRVIAFALNADEHLSFTKGLNADDEPELWVKSLTGGIELWIDFGQLDEKRIKKACGRSKQVIIYTYNIGKAKVWWNQHKDKLERYRNLSVYHIHVESIDTLVQKNMEIQCNIQDGEMYLIDANQEYLVTFETKKV